MQTLLELDSSELLFVALVAKVEEGFALLTKVSLLESASECPDALLVQNSLELRGAYFVRAYRCGPGTRVSRVAQRVVRRGGKGGGGSKRKKKKKKDGARLWGKGGIAAVVVWCGGERRKKRTSAIFP